MPSPSRLRVVKTALRYLLALAMMFVGISHFQNLGGAGLLVPRVRRAAAWGLIALYVAVFPANVNMAINHISLTPEHPIPTAALWLRLPLQAVLIALAWWFTRKDPPGDGATPGQR
jgi:uncharacterized membrane protein